MRARTRRPSFAAFVLLLLLGTTAGHAQFPPDSLVNLQFFPNDIETRELIGHMRGFAMGLGVRCQYCHVGEEGMPLAEFDFPSDEKTTKQIAREMLKMVREINTAHLANLPERAQPTLVVECATCHRGQARPIMIEELLQQVIADHGIDSAKVHYRALRADYYGSYTYDFSEGSLNRLAESFFDRGEFAQTIEVLRLNEEFFPESSGLQYMLGEAFAANGDRQMAITQMERALELNPNFGRAKQRLEQLKQP